MRVKNLAPRYLEASWLAYNRLIAKEKLMIGAVWRAENVPHRSSFHLAAVLLLAMAVSACSDGCVKFPTTEEGQRSLGDDVVDLSREPITLTQAITGAADCNNRAQMHAAFWCSAHMETT